MSDKTPIRVVLADHYVLVRSGLAAILCAVPDIDVVGEAGNGQDALYLCDHAHPNVVVMELMMPIMDGITTTRLIRQRYPDSHVLILTSLIDDAMVAESVRAGAMGYVLKNISPQTFINAIREAGQGVSTFAPEVTRALIRLRNSPQEADYSLTEREQEVLVLLADGMSNQEIALHFHISYSTVQFHVSNILSKLGVTNRVEAAAFAIRHNLV